MAYLLDTGPFVDAKRRFYGMDFCPGYWHWLEREARNGSLRSIERVADEISAQQDDLSAWAATLPKGFFLRPDEKFSAAYQRVSQWAISSGFQAAALSEFFDVADSYLVAQALAGGHIVVTLEKPATSPSKKKIKVPDACAGVGVKCITLFSLMQQLHMRLMLEASASGGT